MRNIRLLRTKALCSRRFTFSSVITLRSSTNSEVQVRCEARRDRGQHRSFVPGDPRAPRRQDETRRTVALGHSSDGPSWIDLAEIRVTVTESWFAACLNRLLQQNRPVPDIAAPAPNPSDGAGLIERLEQQSLYALGGSDTQIVR